MTRVLAMCLMLLLVSCGRSTLTTPEASPALSRERLFQALLADNVLDPDRQLVHMSHACSLRVDDQSLPVVDVQELVKGASAPRGVNRI